MHDRQVEQHHFSAHQRIYLAILVVAVTAIYATYALARHAAFQTTGFDLGIFDQVVRAYSEFRAPIVPLKGVGYNILGDHFHPILIALAPLYWVWNDPRVLLIAQAAALGYSCVPVATFACYRLGPRLALWVAALYGLSWPLQRAVYFDVHEIAFGVPILAHLINAVDRRQYRQLLVCSALLVLVREDMGILVAVAGVLVMLQGRAAPQVRDDPLAQPGSPNGTEHPSRSRPPRVARFFRRPEFILGALLVAFGTFCFVFITSIFIPRFGSGFSYWTFSALGAGPVDALHTLVTRPWQVVAAFFVPIMKTQTLVAILLPVTFLCVRSRYFMLALPILAECMLNDRRELWSTNFHYTSIIAPVLFMGAIDVITRQRRSRFSEHLLRPLRPRLNRCLDRIGAALKARSAAARSPQRRRVHGWLMLCTAIAISGFLTDPDYTVRGLVDRGLWVRDARWHAIVSTLPSIPPGECVAADNEIAPHLTHRNYVTRVDRASNASTSRDVRALWNDATTWIILDMEQEETGWQGGTPAAALAMATSRGFSIAENNWPIVLLHRDQPVEEFCRTG